jgi:LuxR family maltose regulon positive regulatory protein
MSAPLLMTKLYIPPVRPELVSRPRLIERLDRGLRLGHRLTLISAPAGFGKTTLLSEWISSRQGGRETKRQEEHLVPSPPCPQVSFAWLSLDAGDNDPARFLAYVIAALQTIEEDIGRVALDALQSPQPPPLESVLTGVINEIAAIAQSDRQVRPYVLVLDDYHVIKARSIHDALAFLLDHLPLHMHLVVTTRSDPPIPIARLRGCGQLTDLRLADLRFTPGEVTEFLNRVMGLDLSADDVATLASRTEGWAAGLQMAAIAMRSPGLPQAAVSTQEKRANVADFIQAFTGSNRYILDYLLEEILQRQSENIQTFLLQTSVLDRLTGPLCDAVVGQVGNLPYRSQEILEHLERHNLFVVPLDDERQWYRYHHLFAALLRKRLQQTQPDTVPRLHRRAAEWYEHHGLVAAAIEHALPTEDFERAARLIEQATEATVMRSEIATLRGWVEALPDDVVRARPILCVYHAVALLLSSHPLDVVEARLRDAMEADATGSVSGEVTAFRALIVAYQGDLSQSAELSHRALELLPKERLFFRGVAAGCLGFASLLSGDVVVARRALNEAARIGQQAGNLVITALALCNLGELSGVIQGRLGEARAFYDQMLELAADGQGRPRPAAGAALMGLGELLREWNDLEAATRHLTEGIELTRQLVEAEAIHGYVGLARVRQAQGNAQGAREAIQIAEQLAIKFDATEIDDLFVAGHKARLCVAQGDIEAALRWVEEHRLDEEVRLDKLPLHRTFEYITLAHVRIAQGRPDEALKVLRSLLPATEAAGWMGFVIEIRILESLALQAQGNVAHAITALEHALSLAEPEGHVQIFISWGPPMARLLYEAAARGVAPEYTGKLLAAFPVAEPAAKSRKPPAELIEPLSTRELEVLQLIAAGASNPEIAQKLVIAVNTVKKHVNSIFGKLAVTSRTQAVARARGLGLID